MLVSAAAGNSANPQDDCAVQHHEMPDEKQMLTIFLFDTSMKAGEINGN